MTEDERPTLVTIPTEMERGDSFVVFTVGIASLLAFWWAVQQGVPLLWLAGPSVALSVWMLTHRATTDVRFVGGIAVMVRNRLGERDVHEWFLALGHYINLVYVPIWRAHCVAFWRSCRRRIASWRARLSARMRWLASRVCSWASAIPFSSSRRPAK